MSSGQGAPTLNSRMPRSAGARLVDAEIVERLANVEIALPTVMMPSFALGPPL